MMKTYAITKRGGTVPDRGAIHRWLDSQLDLMPNGERVLSLEKRRTGRSLSQNRLFWLWMACIADETGSEKQDIHDHYCRKFLMRNIEFNGRPEQVMMTTSQLDKETFTYFLNRVQTDAASELGIRLPSPEDEAWAEFEEYYKSRI